MTRSFQHARFIPSEEIDAKRVRQWHFGTVGQSAAGGLQPLVPELPVLGDLLPRPSARPQAPPEVSEELESAREENAALAAQLQAAQIEQMLEQARQEARDAAYQEGLEAGLTQGREEGFQQGHEAGTAEGKQKMDFIMLHQGRKHAAMVQGIMLKGQSEFQGLHEKLSQELLNLAADIARQVVRQELRSNPNALLPVVKEALDMLGAELKPAVVRLNPADFESVGAALKAANPQPKIEWLADNSVASGDCIIESAGAQVDGSLERRWQRAVAALGLVSTWYEGVPSHAQ